MCVHVQNDCLGGRQPEVNDHLTDHLDWGVGLLPWPVVFETPEGILARHSNMWPSMVVEAPFNLPQAYIDHYLLAWFVMEG